MRPEYKSGMCHRLRSAARLVSKHPGSRHHLEMAAQTIIVFREAQFPADFIRQYREITAVISRDWTASIPEVIPALSDDEVAALSKKIIALYEDVCEPDDRRNA
jgi:hypothetical protein